MGIRQHVPNWIEVETTRLDDGRLAGLIRVPESDESLVEIVLPLPLLGQLVADADEVRRTAPAWG